MMEIEIKRPEGLRGGRRVVPRRRRSVRFWQRIRSLSQGGGVRRRGTNPET